MNWIVPLIFALCGVFFIFAAPQVARDTDRRSQRGRGALIGNISVLGSRFIGAAALVLAVAWLIFVKGS